MADGPYPVKRTNPAVFRFFFADAESYACVTERVFTHRWPN